MRVTVTPGRCIGAGQCVLAAPEVFDQDEDAGTVLVRQSELRPEETAAVRQAIDACPAQVLGLAES